MRRWRIGVVHGVGNAEPGQLHQLVDGEFVLVEELNVDGLGLALVEVALHGRHRWSKRVCFARDTPQRCVARTRLSRSSSSSNNSSITASVWEISKAFVHRDRYCLLLTRWYQAPQTWRGQMVLDARLCAVHLVRSATPFNTTEFTHVGEVLGQASVTAALAASPAPSGNDEDDNAGGADDDDGAVTAAAPNPKDNALPLAFGCNADAAVIEQSGTIVVAASTWSDMADGRQPLDPYVLFDQSLAPGTPAPPNLSVVDGQTVAHLTFGPRLEPRYSYVGSVPVPPLCIAVSQDGGETWALSSVRPGGLAPRLLYDPSSGVLALARSAVRFPHCGHCFQFSVDQAATWSKPLAFGGAHTRTSGELALLRSDTARFTVLFDETAVAGLAPEASGGGALQAVPATASEQNAIRKVTVLVKPA
eukprot:m.104179 g.104179  ORF g.104179 m.104179 type:complete len:419 (+) comp15745_c0_seq1:903-2159(+)